MKTLKKSLCLVLALVFVLSLCTVCAGAAFTDDDQIKYEDAVGIMADLGILSGMGDGTFAPKATVTRAQAAKMIAYMILGATNAEKMPAAGGMFTDVNAGDWYAKYVGYCAKQGIINGMGDGTFRPDDPVTGTALAKLILCALGRGKAGEYVGEGWDFNAVADALTYGIYDNSEAADFSDPATREESALYVYNALINVKQQSYKDGEYTDAGNQTFGQKVWKLVNKTGILMSNKAAGDTATFVLIDGDTTTTKFEFDTELGLIGHEVRVLYKEKEDKTVASVYSISDISTTIAQFAPVAANVKTAATVYGWANYIATPDTAYVAATKGAANNNLIVYDNTVIGYTLPETFSIAQVKSVDAKTGAYTLDDGTVTDKTWTLCGAAANDYIEVVKVGANTITRATSKFENIKVTQITNASGFFANSYNNGQFVQSGATNVASYLKEAASKLTLGNAYTFYKDSFGNFFRVENYVAPDTTTTTAVFFVKAFTIKGTTTVDEWGNNVTAKDACYAQCVTADGESVNYSTGTAETTIARGPADLKFDDKGVASLTAAPSSEVELVASTNFKTAATKIPAKPYYLTSDCNIIVLSGKLDNKGNEQAAELGTLKVTTSTGSLKGDFSASKIYVAIPKTTANAKDIQTIWIDGAAKPAAEEEKPVANSYIYITNTTQVGKFLVDEVKKTEVGTYNVYLDGVAKQIAIDDSKAAPGTGFFTYTVKNDVYTLTAIDATVTVKSFAFDAKTTLIYSNEFSSTDSALDAKSVAGMKVADLRNPATLATGEALITDIAGLESYKGTTALTLTVLMSSKGAFIGGVIYIG